MLQAAFCCCRKRAGHYPAPAIPRQFPRLEIKSPAAEFEGAPPVAGDDDRSRGSLNQGELNLRVMALPNSPVQSNCKVPWVLSTFSGTLQLNESPEMATSPPALEVARWPVPRGRGIFKVSPLKTKSGGSDANLGQFEVQEIQFVILRDQAGRRARNPDRVLLSNASSVAELPTGD